MTRYSRLYIFAAVLLLAFAVNTYAANTVTTDHFTVSYGDGARLFADIVARSAEDSYDLTAETLGVEPDGPIEIVLTQRADEFKRLTRGVLPDWSAAAALPGNRIVISPLEGRKLSVEHIVAHEIVHIFINFASGEQHVPRWFHEGCAEELSGTWGVRGRLYMVYKTMRGELLTFETIQQVFSVGNDDATLAYDQSMLAVRHLMREKGRGILARILSDMSSGQSFDEAFLGATGFTVVEFEPRYLAKIRRSYGRRSFITLVPGTWTIILLLAFIVYGVKKIRNRRLLRIWEEEERSGNIIDFPPAPDDWD